MKHLASLIILINIVGLSVVQVLEVWRPGSVAALIGLGWLLGGALLSTVLALLLRGRD